jgi:hypothetical protein
LSASYLGINKHFVEHSAALQEGAEELEMVRLTGKISAKEGLIYPVRMMHD